MQSPQEIMIIRQLDRDLALAGDRLHSRQIYQRTLWIPDEEHRQALAETLDQLRYRVDQLTDDNEASHFFIHHFHDVLDFLTWEAEDFWTHPQVQLGEIQHALKQLWSVDQRRRSLRIAILGDQWLRCPLACRLWNAGSPILTKRICRSSYPAALRSNARPNRLSLSWTPRKWKSSIV